MAEKYRPSNGTEGDWFMSQFCDRCAKDTEASPCPIIAATMALDVDDPDYPEEWIEDDSGPRCTAFASTPTAARKEDGRG